MNVQPDVVAQPMDEILAQRFAVLVFAVRIDVLVSDVEQRVFLIPAAHDNARLQGGESGILRAEDNVVNLALARCVFSVGRNGARDVGGVTGVLRAHIHDDNIAVLDFSRKLVVVQRRGIGTRADNGGVASISEPPIAWTSTIFAAT